MTAIDAERSSSSIPSEARRRTPGAARADRPMGSAAGDHDPGDLAVAIASACRNAIPQYILPRPGVVLSTLVQRLPACCSPRCWSPCASPSSALLLAVVGGVGLAVLFAQSKWVEMAFFPFAIVLQVTPIVAIAPLITDLYVDNQTTQLLLCAWLVAFFPILSNTALGSQLVDHNLLRHVRALWRDALAAVALSAAAGGDALFPGRV